MQFIFHYMQDSYDTPTCFGGATVIIDEDTGDYGVSVCSLDERFSRKEGATRAIKDMIDRLNGESQSGSPFNIAFNKNISIGALADSIIRLEFPEIVKNKRKEYLREVYYDIIPRKQNKYHVVYTYIRPKKSKG